MMPGPNLNSKISTDRVPNEVNPSSVEIISYSSLSSPDSELHKFHSEASSKNVSWNWSLPTTKEQSSKISSLLSMYLCLEFMSCPYHPHECICKNQLEEYFEASTSNPHPEDFCLSYLSNLLPIVYWQNA